MPNNQTPLAERIAEILESDAVDEIRAALEADCSILEVLSVSASRSPQWSVHDDLNSAGETIAQIRELSDAQRRMLDRLTGAHAMASLSVGPDTIEHRTAQALARRGLVVVVDAGPMRRVTLRADDD